MTKTLLALYGLKWNPFAAEVPLEALLTTPKVEAFCWRIEQSHVREGGFALITGDPGTGKSVVLRVLAERLARVRDLTVGALPHPQSHVADFYRELGDLLGVALNPHNRWNGFKTLRERWLAHLESTLLRPVLLIDEAQEMQPLVLSELRLLTSAHFDSRALLRVVLAGDGRLSHLWRRDELRPLGSRIRTRLSLEYASREELRACLEHLLDAAGHPTLLTAELKTTLCEHALGNYRVLTTMPGELLAVAAQRELAQLDEKLYLDVFAPPRSAAPAQRPPATGRGGSMITPLPVRLAHELDSQPHEHRWLIEDLWATEAVGIVGGEPKCCKSFLALDVAGAVASGAPCLRRFRPARTGRVLLFAAEDALHVVRARLAGIAEAAGVAFETLDIQVITAPSVRLDLPEDQQRLRETVAILRPTLLVLDPFVRLHRIDENAAAEVAPVLAYRESTVAAQDVRPHVARRHEPGHRAGAPGAIAPSARAAATR